MRKLLFAYINAKTKLPTIFAVTAQLISAFVFATEIIQMFRIPRTGFLATRLIFNYNYKQPIQEGLSGCSQCMGMERLGWVKASH